MKTSLKDWKKVYRRLKNLPELDEHECILYARSIATPDEGWQMNVNLLRSPGCWGRAVLTKFGSDRIQPLARAGKATRQ